MEILLSKKSSEINAKQLVAEAKAIGITTGRIRTKGNKCFIEIDQNEESFKTVVNNHSPKSNIQEVQDEKNAYASLMLDSQRIDFLAKKLGLK